MKRVNPTNVVLGIIAAEVVLLTMKAFAERLPGEVAASEPVDPPAQRKSAGPFLIVDALRCGVARLRDWIFGAELDSPIGRRIERGREKFYRDRKQDSGYLEEPAGDGEGEILLKGDMQGVAEKLKDPAWAGVLAANDGNISLTNAERAVPMPNPAKLVQRLDRNSYVGKGMKDHSRGPH